MKKKIMISMLILFIGIIAIILIPIYKIDKTFTYEIDKDNGTVTITGYLGDDSDREMHDKFGVDPSYPEKIEIPATIKGYPVTAIGDAAFEFARAREVIIPDTVKSIGREAFYGCANLESVTGMNNVEVLGKHAFGECHNLESITGTDNIRVLGESVFTGCKALEELDIASVVDIGMGAFSGCEKLESIVIPNTVKKIPWGMCLGMDSLETVEIPDSVESMDGCAFGGCYGLESVYIPPSVTSINRSAFYDVEDQITIYGEKDSYAEEFANTYGIKFEEMSYER